MKLYVRFFRFSSVRGRGRVPDIIHLYKSGSCGFELALREASEQGAHAPPNKETTRALFHPQSESCRTILQ